MRSLTYEIILAGQADGALRAQFDDCEITVDPDTTTLRAVLPDQAALGALVLRIIDFRLEMIELRLLSASPGDDGSPAHRDPQRGGGRANT